jgi:hypothetical protein
MRPQNRHTDKNYLKIEPDTETTPLLTHNYIKLFVNNHFYISKVTFVRYKPVGPIIMTMRLLTMEIFTKKLTENHEKENLQ